MFRHIKITHWLHHLNPWLNPQVRSQRWFLSLSLLTCPLLWRYPTISHYISHNASTYPTISHYIPFPLSHYIPLYQYVGVDPSWFANRKNDVENPTMSRSFSLEHLILLGFPHRCHVHPRVHTWLCSRGSNKIYIVHIINRFPRWWISHS